MKIKPNIIFLPIKTNQQKIKCICHYAQKHFDAQDSLCIMAPTQQAVQYLDDLLWKFPENSFLPHAIAHVKCQEKIIISTICQNLNDAKVLMNLCTEPCPIVEQFELIYELYDETQLEKFDQAKHRFKFYAEKGFNPQIENSQFN